MSFLSKSIRATVRAGPLEVYKFYGPSIDSPETFVIEDYYG
jgi:hypothetical protein